MLNNNAENWDWEISTWAEKWAFYSINPSPHPPQAPLLQTTCPLTLVYFSPSWQGHEHTNPKSICITIYGSQLTVTTRTNDLRDDVNAVIGQNKGKRSLTPVSLNYIGPWASILHSWHVWGTMTSSRGAFPPLDDSKQCDVCVILNRLSRKKKSITGKSTTQENSNHVLTIWFSTSNRC